jgi:hypothetical protein
MEFIGHFSPWRTERRPCWHCVYFDGMLFGGSAAECSAPGSAKVRAMPKDGCSQWEREPGVDDEPGPPGDPANVHTGGKLSAKFGPTGYVQCQAEERK